MNKFSEQLLQAFDIAMNEATSKLRYDKTIQAKVIEVKDLDTGEYKVEYNDGIISAYAIDPSEVYKVNEYVYVTVPEGDFSNKKFIQYRITGNSLSTAQTNQLQNMIIEVSPNFSELGYTYVQGEQGLCIGSPLPDEISLLAQSAADASTRFQAYANEYEYLKIKASFREEFVEDHATGDFGICVIFKNQTNEDVPYFLNINDFNGDPYHLLTWSPQETVVRIPKGELKSLSAIQFYEKDFESEGSVINLFVKDLSLSFVKIRDLSSVPYYLSIIPLDGLVFTDNLSSLVLDSHIIHYGETIGDTYCLYQWYVRDLSIMPGVEGYNKEVGWGWRALENETSAQLIVAKSSVPWKQQYKLIALYNNDTLMEDEITLANVSSNINLTIKQVTTNETVKLKLSDNNYVGSWYYLSSDGHLELLNQIYSSEIDVTNYLRYAPLSFYCQVYRNSSYVGELTYLMRDITSETDISVIFEGEDIFCYDGNGAIEPFAAQKERSLTARIIKNKEDIGIKSIEWLDFKGRPIGETSEEFEYRDMIRSARIKVEDVDLPQKIVYYSINQNYSLEKAQNVNFTIRITTLNNQIYNFNKQIYFTKTGDPGTNGTRYTSLIKVTSANKFVGSARTVTLTCYVYKDSYQFNSASISWSLIGVTTPNGESPTNGASITVKASGDSNIRYVKATIRISDNGESTTFYNFFPIDTSSAASTADLSELPQYIQYDSNGINPQYYKYGLSNISGTITSETTSLIDVEDGEFIVADVFDPANHVGLLKVVQNNITLYHPIPMYINTYGNEAINGWDGVSVDLGDDQDSHVFAPQVGAGTKNTTNQFTGVVMGKDSQQNKIGLYGYKAGINTFGLTEDGIAYFGVENDGRITLNGTNATITGGGGGNNANGMTITLAATDATNDAIRVGNENFVVKYNGSVIANSAEIKGKITATSGKIGSWNITDYLLYSGNTYLVGSNQLYWLVNRNTHIIILDEGAKYYTNASLSANEAISTGRAVILNDYSLVYNSYRFTFQTGSDTTTFYYSAIPNFSISSSDTAVQDYYRIWAGSGTAQNARFYVTNSGVMKATDANITGTIYAKIGQIGCNPSNQQGGWTINSYSIASADIKYIAPKGSPYYSGSDQIGTLDADTEVFKSQTGEHFNVEIDNATYTINRSRIVIYPADNTTSLVALNSQGRYAIQAGDVLADGNTSFSVTRSGTMKATNATVSGSITATSGKLGSWNATNYLLYSGTTYLLGSNQLYWLVDRANHTIILTSGAKYYTNNSLSANEAISTGQEVTLTSYSTASGWYSFKFKTGSDTTTTYYSAISNFAIASNDTSTQDYYRIWAGSSTASSAKFSVTNSGVIKASDANVTGTITAKTGYIGWSSSSNTGWEITANTIKSNGVQQYILKKNSKYYTNTNLSANEQTVEADIVIYRYTSISGTVTSFKFEDTDNATVYYSAKSNTTTSNNPGVVLSARGGSYTIWAGNPTASAAPFSVTHTGIVKATGAIISGKITATSGTIGNWNINTSNNNRLESSVSGSGTRIYLNGSATGTDNALYISQIDNPTVDETYYTNDANGWFYVTANGKLYAQAAEIKGTIKSNAGKIGGWILEANKLYYGDNRIIGMSSMGIAAKDSDNNSLGSFTFWSGGTYIAATGSAAEYIKLSSSGTYFAVTTSGKLYCREAEINGSIIANSGTIGGETNGWTISPGKLYSGSGNTYVALDSGNSGTTTSDYAIWAGKATASTAPFRVTRGGAVTASNIAITGGSLKIGGTSSNPNFQVDSNGAVTLNGNITWGSSNKPWTSEGYMTSVTRANIADALLAANQDDGIYTKDGIIAIRASAIQSGEITADLYITSPEIYGGTYYSADKNAYLDISAYEETPYDITIHHGELKLNLNNEYAFAILETYTSDIKETDVIVGGSSFLRFTEHSPANKLLDMVQVTGDIKFYGDLVLTGSYGASDPPEASVSNPIANGTIYFKI